MESRLNIARRLPVGVEVVEGGTHFRVWAPRRKQLAVVIDDRETALAREPGDAGYFSGLVPRVAAGARYRFRLDDEADLRPDPVSRYQPEGVHGPSQVIDPSAFSWSDSQWKGVPTFGQVLYEMHIGTWTPQGTWDAASKKLEHLVDVGINCIEMMPVNEFSGRWNWGYDGVFQFAATRAYGTPDDLRRFVDRAHQLGIGVILDVVYNHFGPDGNYLPDFSDHYFCTDKANDWGQQVNFDDAHSAPTREFFLANVRLWIEEYHFDGFRFDATQAIFDDSPKHILRELTEQARKSAGSRAVYLVNENEPQHTNLVRPPEVDHGIGMDALWNDDFHHSARVALTGRRDAYFTDYAGTPQELLSAIKHGYLYQGQRYRWQGKRRGTPGLDLPPTAFVNYIQNHDQIANYAHGERLHRHTSPAQIRAMTALLLLAPQTPMLFQGQEWGATARFNFFNDMRTPAQRKKFEVGRKQEMGQFPTVGSPEMLDRLLNPSAESSFTSSKLDWAERDCGYHKMVVDLHRDLLRLRREDKVIGRTQKRGDIDGAVVGPWAFILRFFGTHGDDRLLLINLYADLYLDICPEPLMAAPLGKVWTTLLSSEDPKYGGNGHIPPETRGEAWRLGGENWRLISRCTTVLKAATPAEVAAEEAIKARELARHRGE